MQPMDVIAKSNGELLTEHLRVVANTAQQIAENTVSAACNGGNYALCQMCRCAGAAHDIGKAIPVMQDYLHGRGPFPGRYHNEYSAFFVHEYGDQMFADELELAVQTCIGTQKRDWLRVIETAVYWHHAKDDSISNQYDDLNVTVEDLQAMADAWEQLTGKAIIVSEPDYEVTCPSYVLGGTNPDSKLMKPAHNWNPVLMLVQATLIAADRIASGAVAKQAANSKEIWPPIPSVDLPESYKANATRYAEQDEAVGTALSADTCTAVVNAPAGFGKTIVGLRYALAIGGHVLWVLPRNAPLESTYDGIVRELTACHVYGVSVEKVYGHERKGAFMLDDVVPPESPCRITVTNIDAVVEPFGNDNALRIMQIDMLADTIVFDEYHEFVCGEPMYYGFQTLMECRAKYCVARQLLISATPVPLMLADSRVTYIPGKWRSYHAQHSDPYAFTLDGDSSLLSGGAVMNLSVANVQAAGTDDGRTMYVHSKFTDEDRASRFKTLYEGYGKGASGQNLDAREWCSNRPPVSAGPIIQASLDISFDRMAMMLCSPQMMMQCLGRCNRFGDGQTHEVNLMDDGDPGSTQYRAAQYDLTLFHLWASVVAARCDGKELTLDELYSLYGEYMMTHAAEISEWQTRRLSAATAKLNSCLYPVKVVSKDHRKTKGGTTGNVTMRSSSPGIFYVVKRCDSNEYAGPFSASVDDLTRPGSKLRMSPDDVGKEYRKMLLNLRSVAGEQFPELASRLCDGSRTKRERYADYYIRSLFGSHPGQAFRFSETPLIVPSTVLQYDPVKGIVG